MSLETSSFIIALVSAVSKLSTWSVWEAYTFSLCLVSWACTSSKSFCSIVSATCLACSESKLAASPFPKFSLAILPALKLNLLEILNGQYFFLTRINQNELSVEDLDGIFGVCVNLINQKNADYL